MMRLNRRHMLAGAASALYLSSCTGAEGVKDAGKTDVLHPRKAGQPRVGIQTYTIRNAMEADTRSALNMLKDVGYDFIETNDRDFTRISMADFKRIVKDVGFDVPATHMGLEMITGDTQKASDLAAELGCQYLIVPWAPEEFRSPDGYKGLAEAFNQAGEVLKQNGQTFAYHNHQFEFFDLGGPRHGMDILLQETDPDLVTFELDMFWAALSGTDVPAFFERYPGRFKLCHIKDLDNAAAAAYGPPDLNFEAIVGSMMRNVGEGDLPLADWLGMGEVSGIEYFVAEHDSPSEPVKDAVATSLKTIRTYDL